MMFGLSVDSWRGGERLARNLPVTAWSWSEKTEAMPSGRLSVSFPPGMFPTAMADPLRPMGQILRAEIVQDGRSFALPPCRITEASEGVTVVADSIDLDIAEDPWAFPSSPATGATLLREAGRLAAPLVVHLSVPDAALPQGLTWSGKRDEALLDLAASRGLQWRVEPDGSLTAVELGNPLDPERTYDHATILDAPQKAARLRVSKATAVLPAQGDEPPQVYTERTTDDGYQPGVYGTVGKVEQLQQGATQQQMQAAARAMLAESGGTREVRILADPSLRAGMTVRVKVPRPEGVEIILGRVVSHTIKDSGDHTVTITEAR